MQNTKDNLGEGSEITISHGLVCSIAWRISTNQQVRGAETNLCVQGLKVVYQHDKCWLQVSLSNSSQSPIQSDYKTCGCRIGLPVQEITNPYGCRTWDYNPWVQDLRLQPMWVQDLSPNARRLQTLWVQDLRLQTHGCRTCRFQTHGVGPEITNPVGAGSVS